MVEKPGGTPNTCGVVVITTGGPSVVLTKPKVPSQNREPLSLVSFLAAPKAKDVERN